MAEPKVFLSNDSAGVTADKRYLTYHKSGTITADSNGQILMGACPQAGKVTNIFGSVGTVGSDASSNLSLAYVVKKNGTTVCSTEAKIDKTAGTGTQRLTTVTATTGITTAVLKTDGTAKFVAGDTLSFDFDITRAGTPSTEMTDAAIVVEVTFDAV